MSRSARLAGVFLSPHYAQDHFVAAGSSAGTFAGAWIAAGCGAGAL